MPTAKISFFGRFCCTYRIAYLFRGNLPFGFCSERNVAQALWNCCWLIVHPPPSISRQSIPYPGKRNVRRGGILCLGRTVRVALLSFFARFVYIVKQCVQIFLCAFYANSYPIAARQCGFDNLAIIPGGVYLYHCRRGIRYKLVSFFHALGFLK